jgi:excisionase family DNA binding protein
MEGPFMESDECAALIKTTRTAVHNLAHRRRIPHIKCGHRLLLDRNEILQWLEAQRRV